MAWNCSARGRTLLCGLLLVALPQAPVLAQDTYPSRTIRIVVPTGPGGGSTDLSARLLAHELSKRFGQQVVVENRPGAASIVGSEIVARAPPDGYTLLVTPAPLAINPATYRKLPYQAQRDFAPITQLVSVPSVIVIHPSLPARSVREFIAFAKARPRELVYGSPGHGSHPHLTVELFASMANIRMLHVPYSKGVVAAMVDLLAGRIVAMATSNVFQILPHVATAKLRALGVTSAKRSALLPDLPTIAEAGLPGYEALQWTGLLAPAQTPREIIGRLHKEATEILRMPEAKERLASIAAEVVASSPEEFAAFIKAETVKWAKVAKAAGIQPE